jgi:hypothetical protein
MAAPYQPTGGSRSKPTSTASTTAVRSYLADRAWRRIKGFETWKRAPLCFVAQCLLFTDFFRKFFYI